MLLRVRDLSVSFHGRRVLDSVSLALSAGEVLGLVGESGSGKTTVARAVLRLVPASGDVTFNGRDLLALSRGPLRRARRDMQLVFQDPGGSLNPRMRVGEVVAEPLRVHRIARGQKLRARVDELLERCGLPTGAARRFPHAFSGGQKQRIAIARAVALKPKLLICDEPTSALDVSVQAQILNLLSDLQQEAGMAMLFISHDLAVVRHMAGRIAVMRSGRVVESAVTEELIDQPRQPYTRQLLASVLEPPRSPVA